MASAAPRPPARRPSTPRRGAAALPSTRSVVGVSLALAVVVAGAAGCSRGPVDTGRPPATAAPGPSTAVVTADGADSAVVIDTERPVTYDRAEEKSARRNDAGDLWRLDDAGAAACAHAEFAFRAKETGADAGAQVKALRVAAAKSRTRTLREAVAALPASAGGDEALPVLKACTTLGYQL